MIILLFFRLKMKIVKLKKCLHYWTLRKVLKRKLKIPPNQLLLKVRTDYIFFILNCIFIVFYFLEKEINVILNHGAEDAECYGECAARMLITHQNEKPQLSISQVNSILFLYFYYIVYVNVIILYRKECHYLVLQ